MQQEVSETIKEQIEKPATGLRGRSFGAVLRTDRTPERVEFDIDGNPAWVGLLPMDKNHRNEFVTKFGEFDWAEVGGKPVGDMTTYLVGHTVVDFCLWTKARDKSSGEEHWQEVRPGQGKEWIFSFFRNNASLFPDFWDALTLECARANNFAVDDDQGNSLTPSAP